MRVSVPNTTEDLAIEPIFRIIWVKVSKELGRWNVYETANINWICSQTTMWLRIKTRVKDCISSRCATSKSNHQQRRINNVYCISTQVHLVVSLLKLLLCWCAFTDSILTLRISVRFLFSPTQFYILPHISSFYFFRLEINAPIENSTINVPLQHLIINQCYIENRKIENHISFIHL